LDEAGAIAGVTPAEREHRLPRFLRRARPTPISFPELTWAHFKRQEELEAGGSLYAGRAEELYRRFATSSCRSSPASANGSHRTCCSAPRSRPSRRPTTRRAGRMGIPRRGDTV